MVLWVIDMGVIVVMLEYICVGFVVFGGGMIMESGRIGVEIVLLVVVLCVDLLLCVLVNDGNFVSICVLFVFVVVVVDVVIVWIGYCGLGEVELVNLMFVDDLVLLLKIVVEIVVWFVGLVYLVMLI